MTRKSLFAFVAVAGLVGLAVYAQTGSAPNGVPVAAVGGGAQANDEAGLQQTVAAYVQAYNKRDAAALMQYWTANAEFVNEAGVATQGRDAIGESFRKNWKEHPGVTLKVKSSSVKFFKADLAVQTGVAELRTAGGEVDSSPFEAMWVKADGKWQLSRVRDLPDPNGGKDESGTPTALKDLEWLVGDWVFEEAGTKVELSARWFKHKAFLVIDQTVHKNGEEVLSMVQMIGWDANDDTLRSWLFDSHSGFAEGTWARDGNQWKVAAAGTLADGRTGSAVNVWKFVNEDRFEWSSTNREIDGRPSPDLKVQYVRKAAKK